MAEKQTMLPSIRVFFPVDNIDRSIGNVIEKCSSFIARNRPCIMCFSSSKSKLRLRDELIEAPKGSKRSDKYIIDYVKTKIPDAEIWSHAIHFNADVGVPLQRKSERSILDSIHLNCTEVTLDDLEFIAPKFIRPPAKVRRYSG